MNILARFIFSVGTRLHNARMYLSFLFVFEEYAFFCSFFCKKVADDSGFISAESQRFTVKTAGGHFCGFEQSVFISEFFGNTLSAALTPICMPVTENIIFTVDILNRTVIVTPIIHRIFIAVYTNVSV